MAKHKPGLHKDVGKIFDGVWNAQIDNFQQNFNSPEQIAFVKPKPLSLELRPKEAESPATNKATKRTGQFVSSPKTRREKKRLSSISKHLLINLPS